MKNEKLRKAKIERNKKRRVIAKKRHQNETPKQRKIRLKKYAITGSRHGARKIKI